MALFSDNFGSKTNQLPKLNHLHLAGSGNQDLIRQLHDYRLTTAEIIYHLPDHPHLLQSYIWQEFDLAPRFPILQKFLHFWESTLEGKLFSVKVASQELISAAEMRYAGSEFVLN